LLYASGLAPLARLVEDIGKENSRQVSRAVERMRDFDRRFRLIGCRADRNGGRRTRHAVLGCAGEGGGSTGCGALGGEPKPLVAYDSFGVVDPKADEPAITGRSRAGFRGIKIRSVTAICARMLRPSAAVRTMIGPGISLMVDYNQFTRSDRGMPSH